MLAGVFLALQFGKVEMERQESMITLLQLGNIELKRRTSSFKLL